MSAASNKLARLEASLAAIEAALIPPPTRIDCAVLHVTDGKADLARFKRDYGMHPKQVPFDVPLIERVHYRQPEAAQVAAQHRDLERQIEALRAAQARLRASNVNLLPTEAS